MNICSKTNKFKVVNTNGEKDIIKFLDELNIDCHTAFVDKRLAVIVQGYYGNELIFDGYTRYDKDKKVMYFNLSAIRKDNGDYVYRYSKEANNN